VTQRPPSVEPARLSDAHRFINVEARYNEQVYASETRRQSTTVVLPRRTSSLSYGRVRFGHFTCALPRGRSLAAIILRLVPVRRPRARSTVSLTDSDRDGEVRM
jgi:hypothetical protein